MPERLKSLLTHPVFVWLAVCAVMLPGVLSRTFDTTNLWLDEIYTIFTVTRSVADIVEMSAMDAHPPGYYLLLKGWLKPLRMAGIEPTLAAGRLLGVLVWVLSAGAVAGLLNAIAGRAA